MSSRLAKSAPSAAEIARLIGPSNTAEARYSRLMRFFATRIHLRPCLFSIGEGGLGARTCCSPAKAGVQDGGRAMPRRRHFARRLGETAGQERSWTPASAGEQRSAASRKGVLGRGADEQVGGAAIVADVAGAAPQFGGLAIGELAAALDGEAVI